MSGEFRLASLPDWLRSRSKRYPKVGDTVTFVSKSHTDHTICCDCGNGISARIPVACLVPLDDVATAEWEKAVRAVKDGSEEREREMLKRVSATRKSR